MPRNATINVAGMAIADTNPTATAYRSRRFSSARRPMLSIAVSSALWKAGRIGRVRACRAASDIVRLAAPSDAAADAAATLSGRGRARSCGMQAWQPKWAPRWSLL